MVVRTDSRGHVRTAYFAVQDSSQTKSAKTSQKAAQTFIQDVFGISNTPKSSKQKDVELLPGLKKEVQGSIVMEFLQSQSKIPLDGHGITLISDESGAIVAGQNNYDYNFHGTKLNIKELEKHARSITPDLIGEVIDLKGNIRRVRQTAKEFNVKGTPEIKVNSVTQCIYRYEAAHRQHAHGEDGWKDQSLVGRLLVLSLPRVGKNIEEGAYYGVNKVSFTGFVGKMQLTFIALIEPESNSVLSLTPLVDMQSGYIYLNDPVTQTGDPCIHPTDQTAVLNASRNPRSFPLNPTAGTTLQGDFVKIADIQPPTIAPPTSATGTWNYDANTDNFSAVNAYYHCDMIFRLVQDMGFNVNTYFGGTTFPVEVDHRGCCACVNAAAWGTPAGNGLQSMTYGLVQAGAPVGIATDVRIVFHEFGHAICYGNVSSANYGFSHSSGDSMAAIYSDPCSEAPDRFDTFPWLTLSNPGILRRHDRTVDEGWGWGGVHDDGQYGSEQILSTTLFRFYRSLGGDHKSLCERQFASRLALFLNFRATGLLTPGTNPATADAYCDALMIADLTSPGFEGLPGGLTHKMLRWAFEKQNAYSGQPPAVDTYINDGRRGNYEFLDDFCHTKTIWNRLKPDEGGEHQPPVPGQVNYLYVVVENRGLSTSMSGKVSAFHLTDKAAPCCCNTCKNLEWNRDFQKASTPLLGHDPIAAGGYEIVGPFKWKPRENDCVLISVDTQDDHTNLFNIPSGATVPVNHFVPFDNNIAMRCMCNEEKV